MRVTCVSVLWAVGGGWLVNVQCVGSVAVAVSVAIKTQRGGGSLASVVARSYDNENRVSRRRERVGHSGRHRQASKLHELVNAEARLPHEFLVESGCLFWCEVPAQCKARVCVCIVCARVESHAKKGVNVTCKHEDTSTPREAKARRLL